MVTPLDMIGRCEPVFAADQQESRHQDFHFTYPVEDFQIVNHAGVTIATGNFYARVHAHRDHGEVYGDQFWCEILGWYADEAMAVKISGYNTCHTSRPIVEQLNVKSIMDKIEAHADALSMEDRAMTVDTFAPEERRAWTANQVAQATARDEWNTTVAIEGRNPSASFKADLREYAATPERDRSDWLVRWFKRKMDRIARTMGELHPSGPEYLMLAEEHERLATLWSAR